MSFSQVKIQSKNLGFTNLVILIIIYNVFKYNEMYNKKVAKQESKKEENTWAK